jgi:hypothetical protein
MSPAFRHLLALITVGVVSLGASSSLPDKSAVNAYSDATYGFSMATPSFPQPQQDRAVIAIYQAPSEDDFSANVTVMVDPVKTTRKDYVQASMSTMETTNPRANVRSLVEMKVSGKDAELLDYDATMAGRRLRFLQLLVVAEARVYVVTCTAPLDKFPKYEAQFRKCIDSFRLDK